MTSEMAMFEVTSRRFFVVDVFAEEKYAGNPLAVILDCEGLTAEDMLRLTREMNYSESTFITSAPDLTARIFTPVEEVPFAGHPTLGTAYILQREVLRQEVASLTLNLPVGPITVSFEYKDGEAKELWMRQIEPSFGKTIEPGAMANLLKIDPSYIHPDFPIQEVSTGLPFIIVPLTGLEGVKKCAPHTTELLSFVDDYTAKNILVFSPETYREDTHVNARVFTDFLGIPEDPATGSANGCLAGYLAKYQYFGSSNIDIKVEQGYEINRPSLLLLKANADEDSIKIWVGGQVQMIARGELV